MGNSLFNISVSGLNAAQMGILTTSHNISNASTAGFNRQQILQTTNTPMLTGSGFLGQGTNVLTVQRVYNNLLTTQLLTAQTNAAALQTYSNQIGQIDNLLADPSAGLSPALQGFFKAIDEAAANPASVPARQAILSAGQALVARFQGLDQQLGEMRNGINSQISTEVTTINSYVLQIADINQRILVAQAGGGQPANDLYDQRDQLVADLNQEIRVTTHQESDGSYSIFFGTGQPLVVGTQTYQLAAMPGQEDLSSVRIGLKDPAGNLQAIPESLVSGGNLGGLLAFRRETLDPAQNAIGRIALSLATQFNTQHVLGQDLTGSMGGNFFNPIQLSTLGAPSNAGTGVLSANIVDSDYMLRYDKTQGGYTITRLADDKTLGTFSTLPQVVDGIRFSLASGAPQNGDTFLIQPGAAADKRVTAYAGNAGTATLASTGSNIQTLTDSDYRLTLVGPNSFTLERISDNQIWRGTGIDQASALADLMTNAAPQGFDLQLSGKMAVDDSFLIRPTRNAARDISLAISDPTNIALAAPIRTSAALTNAGTATISSGTVADASVLLQAPFSVRYEASSDSLVGFPVGATVKVGSTTYQVTSENARIPYTAGAIINVNGVGATISGTPADGDVFTFAANTAPPIAPPSIGNTGFATLFGIPTNTAAVAGPPAAAGFATAGLSLAGSTTITTGSNDQFRLSLDGGAAVTVTIPQGTYTPATLRAAVQTAVDTAFGSPPLPSPASVTLNSNNQLVITSATVGPGSAVTLSSVGNSGTGIMTSAPVTGNNSLPTASITLCFNAAQAAAVPPLPDRLTGFPVGSVVMVTPPGGRPTSYVIGQTTDYVPYISGAELSFNGLSFSISGSAVDGDTFTVGPNPSGVSDNRNAGLMAALQTLNAMADGTSTFQSAYSQIVSQIGNKAREVDVTLTTQQNLVKQGETAIQSQSGVNLDEEAANLLRYQQAYQAAAKIINISSKLFDELLNIGR